MDADKRNLEGVIEILQDDNAKNINRYLQLGWVVLNVHTTTVIQLKGTKVQFLLLGGIRIMGRLKSPK